MSEETIGAKDERTPQSIFIETLKSEETPDIGGLRESMKLLETSEILQLIMEAKIPESNVSIFAEIIGEEIAKRC